LEREEENAAWPRTAAVAGVAGERQQWAQHCRRWKRMARGDDVNASARGGSTWASGDVVVREKETLQA
jgi:hypothetical protein